MGLKRFNPRVLKTVQAKIVEDQISRRKRRTRINEKEKERMEIRITRIMIRKIRRWKEGKYEIGKEQVVR